ncbi:hypothetical protein Tco_1513946 [Tanacetum coccineum]
MVPRIVLTSSGPISLNTARPVNTVNTVKGTRVNTARLKAVLSTVKGNKRNAVKASACLVWRGKHKVLDHVFKNNGASMSFKIFEYIDAQGRSKSETDPILQIMKKLMKDLLPLEEEKKDAEDPRNEDSEVSSTEEPRVNQEKDANVKSTNTINTVSPTVNAASIEDNTVDENIVYGCANDPNIPDLEDISSSENDVVFGA